MTAYEYAPELKERDRWICWRYEKQDGERTDSPIAPYDSTTYASVSAPETWGSYEVTVKYHNSSDTNTDGVAYVLGPDDPVAIADLLGCTDPESPNTEKWALDIMMDLPSYTEVLPTESDLRVFVLGSVPEGRSRQEQERTLDALDGCSRGPAVELYDEGEYVRFTGNSLEAVPESVEEHQGGLNEVYAEYIAGNSENKITGTSTQGSTGVPTQLTPKNVVKAAGKNPNENDLGNLSDRMKAGAIWKLIERSDSIHLCVRRDNAALLAFDDGIWKPEAKRTLRHAARRALGSIHYGKHIVSELEEQAKSDPDSEVKPEDLGLETSYVAVENGLLDLEAAANGDENAVRELRPENYALTRLPVEYDPTAEYDEWADLVEEWAEDGKVDALQEYVGYCLHIGDLPIHRALMLVGSGANGKGTFLAVVRALLGPENTSSVELQTLASERDAVADMYGSLANIDDDLSARKLNAGLGTFKKLVAGDRVRARRLYEDAFEYKAMGKHLYAANEVPQVDVPDDDEAFWRRWLLIEFPNHYPPSERDPELRDRLSESESLSGVLNWAIEGWNRLRDQEYFTNEEQLAHDKRRRWQAWGDSVDEFISECVENDPNAERLTTGEAHQQYQAWCRENNRNTVGQRQFTNTLKNEDVGYGKHRIDGTSTLGYDELGLSDIGTELDGGTEDSNRGMSF